MTRSKKTTTKKSAPKAEKPKVKTGRASALKPRAKRVPIAAQVTDPKGYVALTSARAVSDVHPEVWTAFLATLAETGHVKNSCEAVGLNRITAYTRRRDDEDFRKLWEEAHQIGMSCLEDEAKRRAYEGVTKGVYYKGDRVDEEVVYSDALLMFLMQGRDTRYKRKQEITGADGGPLLALAKLDDEGLEDLIQQKLRELKETPEGEV